MIHDKRRQGCHVGISYPLPPKNQGEHPARRTPPTTSHRFIPDLSRGLQGLPAYPVHVPRHLQSCERWQGRLGRMSLGSPIGKLPISNRRSLLIVRPGHLIRSISSYLEMVKAKVLQNWVSDVFAPL